MQRQVGKFAEVVLDGCRILLVLLVLWGVWVNCVCVYCVAYPSACSGQFFSGQSLVTSYRLKQRNRIDNAAVNSKSHDLCQKPKAGKERSGGLEIAHAGQALKMRGGLGGVSSSCGVT